MVDVSLPVGLGTDEEAWLRSAGALRVKHVSPHVSPEAANQRISFLFWIEMNLFIYIIMSLIRFLIRGSFRDNVLEFLIT